jgi:hypothetical protein
MIFEDRYAQRPSNAVVGFRDALEEATAAARVARSDGSDAPPRAPANAPVQVAASAEATLPATTVNATDPAPQPGAFQSVDDTPATAEPLPATP